MAWIYLAESAESPWPLNQWSEQSPTAKTTDTLNLSFYHAWQAGEYPALPSGMTFERWNWESLVKPGPSWTSSQADSHARTSAVQELERVWQEADQAYFSKSFASLANFDPDSFSWKTSQLSLFGGLTEFSWSSPRWGTIVDGRLYQPQKWEPRTLESDGSYWLTPRASDTGKGEKQDTFLKRMGDMTDRCAQSLAAQARNPKTWPTPTASEGAKGGPGRKYGNGDMTLSAMAHVSTEATGQLNPTWVEWLMGYPIGWTALEDWATQWFRSKRERPSKDLSESAPNLEAQDT